MTSPVYVLVSIDTEEDNWRPARQGITVENIRELPRLSRFLEQLGVRPTYFVTYQVARQRWAATLLADLASGEAEIGAHLHPWNTPPLTEAFEARNTMTMRLSPELQASKIASLTDTLTEHVGIRPESFRTGRWGFGPETAAALIACGYRADSSVTPFKSWRLYDDGPTFVGAPLHAFRIDGRGDARVPVPDGPLAEVPVSWAHNRTVRPLWNRLFALLNGPLAVRFRIPIIASRLHLMREIALAPELFSLSDMLTLSRHLVEGGLRHLHLFWHSPTMQPGLTPFTKTSADVERLYGTIEAYLDKLTSFATPMFVTVGTGARALSGLEVGDGAGRGV